MHGWCDADTRTVARRIAAELPHVRLVALLREPVARARSQHAMARARGRERRGAEEALREQLGADALRSARRAPADCNSYVVQGEYGRVLGDYLDHLPRTALHVELSDSLAREPVAVVHRILRFLGVADEYAPPQPARRSFAGGGAARASDAALVALLGEIDAAPVEAHAGIARRWLARNGIDAAGWEELQDAIRRYGESSPAARGWERGGLEFALRKIWNVVPAPPEPISGALQEALVAHYAEDARALQAAIATPLPWAAPA
jgi:hypothetical protein